MRPLETLRQDAGMTIIETMVATMILITGIVGAFGAYDGIRRLGTISEKKQEASRYAQREIEHLRSVGFAYLYLSSQPGAMNDSRGTIVGSNYTPPNGGTASPLRIGSGCTATTCVDPGPTAWTAGNASGYIYRYVTSEDDTTCGAPCTPAVDRLRITVAVTVSSPHNPINALVASTLVIDPTARPNGTTAPTNPVQTSAGTAIGAATGTTYYFTDTPVGATYAAPSAGHAVRDTVTATGVPDQLRTTTPSAPGSGAVVAQSYSTDIAPGANGGLGLTGSSTCTGTTKQTAHVWATPVLNASTAVTATGNAAITLPTSTWSAAETSGKVCIKVYDLILNGSNQATTSTLLGTYTYTIPEWPADTETIAFPFRYLASGSTTSIAATHRLGVRLTVDSANSSGLSFVYDHPNFAASVQLETQ